MNESDIITIVNQVIGGKTTALEVIDSLRVSEVVLSRPCTITAQDKADFESHGLEFVRVTSAMRLANNEDGLEIAPALMFRILE